ncbi:MAG: hypothetical protein M3R24_28200, partial [Chloroflexota bacterium]|nr:hypothetical protein [Chloroflexota bacterium]
MSQNFQARLLEEIFLFFEPVIQIRDDPEAVYRLAFDLGWDLKTLLGPSEQAFFDALETLVQAQGGVQKAAEVPPESLVQFLDAFESVTKATSALTALSTVVRSARPSMTDDQVERFGVDLLHWHASHYIAMKQPFAWYLLHLFTLIEFTETEEDAGAIIVDGTDILRHPIAAQRLRLGRLGDLFADPTAYLKSVYLPDAIEDHNDAVEAANRLFPLLKWLVTAGGGLASHGTHRLSATEAADPENAPLHRMMALSFPVTPGLTLGPSVGLTLTIIPKNPPDLGGPGLLIVPWGEAGLSFVANAWEVALQLDGGAGGFLVKKDSVQPVGQGAEQLRISFLLKRGNSDENAFAVGSTIGSRLEVGSIVFSGEIFLSKDVKQLGCLLEVGQAAFVFTADEADSFLQKVLPKDGFRTDFDLAVGWSNLKGVYFRGSAGLEATLPVHKSILGVLTVESIYLALRTQEIESGAQDPAIETVAVATAKVALGPFKASVERMGLVATFTFPPKGGNLGPVNVALGFKPPDGAGLVLDAEAIVGAGYLLFDPENGQYAGILQLEVKGGIALKAIGLLSTRMPDGSKGFSLLIIITAEFPPIQLGY